MFRLIFVSIMARTLAFLRKEKWCSWKAECCALYYVLHQSHPPHSYSCGILVYAPGMDWPLTKLQKNFPVGHSPGAPLTVRASRVIPMQLCWDLRGLLRSDPSAAVMARVRSSMASSCFAASLKVSTVGAARAGQLGLFHDHFHFPFALIHTVLLMQAVCPFHFHHDLCSHCPRSWNRMWLWYGTSSTCHLISQHSCSSLCSTVWLSEDMRQLPPEES